MCVTFFCLQPSVGSESNIQFVIGFNRDQKAGRGTDPLGPFKEDPNVYAGKDKISGGTWLGVNVKTGIMVILTNFQLPVQRQGKSRGKLVFSFLRTESYKNVSVQDYDLEINRRLCAVLKQRQKYSAFNLLVYNIQAGTIFYICSEMQSNQPRLLKQNQPYGMCNGPLEQVWQKTRHGLNKFEDIISGLGQCQNPKQYFFGRIQQVLKDNLSFNKDLEKEASIFISPYYCQTEKTQRMTKCSFIGIVRRKQNTKSFQLEMKQITYQSSGSEQTCVQYTKTIGEQCKQKEQSKQKGYSKQKEQKL